MLRSAWRELAVRAVFETKCFLLVPADHAGGEDHPAACALMPLE